MVFACGFQNRPPSGFLQPVTLLKKGSPVQVIFCKFSEIFLKTFFKEKLRATAFYIGKQKHSGLTWYIILNNITSLDIALSVV